MKPRMIISIVLIAIIAVLAFRFSQKKPAVDEAVEKKPTLVSTQTVDASHNFRKTITYPAIVASNQQATLTAKTSGTITRLNFDLGKKVSQGQRLATIDSVGASSEVGKNGLQSSRIQSLELAVKSAKENFRVVRNAYNRDETYDKKKAKEIAEISLRSAEADLKGALDDQFVVAPISGTIVNKAVSVGDSISTGQSIATISQLGKLEIQFFVDKDELPHFKIGDEVNIIQDNSLAKAKISLISPQADESTKRFLIKAAPLNSQDYTIGSVVTVEFAMNYTPQSQENLVLPLSSIVISQNENYIFITKDKKVIKTNVEIIRVFGEMAEIKASLNNDDEIIINGSKLVKEGEEIVMENK